MDAGVYVPTAPPPTHTRALTHLPYLQLRCVANSALTSAVINDLTTLHGALANRATCFDTATNAYAFDQGGAILSLTSTSYSNPRKKTFACLQCMLWLTT